MAGQSAGNSLGSVKAAISEICERGGVSAMETSAIGGMGRKGGPGEGPDIPKDHCICEEFVSRMGGEATTGTTGYNSGFGHTS